MVPDQDLLLGLRLSPSREPGLSWGLYLPQALLGQSQSLCAVSAQDNYSIHAPECTSPISSHTHSPTPCFPCRTGPYLTQPKDCRKEVSCAPEQGTSCSLGWLGNLQAIRALSDGEGEA